MEKKSLNVDPLTIGRYAAGGALAGGGVAALVNLVHMVREMNEERKKRTADTETDENTIVLNLPKKAEIVGTSKEPVKLKHVSGSHVSDKVLKAATRNNQIRHFDGQYGKKASTGWPTLTMSTLAGIGGATLGAALVDKLYELRREKQLKRELDQAKEEYAGVLSGTKSAEWVERLFSLPADDGEKQADSSSFGMLNYPMAAMALLTILGAGGTGYLTKKILDEKLRQTEEASTDIPKIKRIVLRTAPTTDKEKMASAEDIEGLKVQLMCQIDGLSQQPRYLTGEAIEKAAQAAGMTTNQVADMSLTDPNFIRTLIDKNPELYRILAQQTGHGFVSKLPGARRIVSNRLAALAQGLQDGSNVLQKKVAQTAGAGGGSGATGGNQGMGMLKLRGKTKIKPRPIWMKASQDISMATPVISTLIGRNKTGPDAGEIAEAIIDKQNEQAHEKTLENIKEPDVVRIEADDPNAKKYLTRNQHKLVKVIKRLASEGQL